MYRSFKTYVTSTRRKLCPLLLVVADGTHQTYVLGSEAAPCHNAAALWFTS